MLLESSTLLVKAIAIDVGYASTVQLDRHFTKIYGVSPTAYREACHDMPKIEY